MGGNHDGVARPLRITLAPGAPPVLEDLQDPHLLVVTRGTVSLNGDNDQPFLSEGEVTTLQPGSYTVRNPCDDLTMSVLLLPQ